ncbi:hypothetical protein N7466_005720 [Penicillium verhagenii]|uniref:uncharacterized protein n=1 Tax=Penicillium verhagenii TaxID=1562060 RepID=UPI0025450680|nr:uncharacterized protein N7466_005720 [Penicillium verhagenii]KAJ5930227.1 hypothetical protein N7466_005720 [Penicillium verhagenii]
MAGSYGDKASVHPTPSTSETHKIALTAGPTPGPMARRLEGLENWSSATKIKTLDSIANDIAATLVIIGKHTESGHLDESHTSPISDVLDSILKTQERWVEDKKALFREHNRLRRREFQRYAASSSEALVAYQIKVSKLKGEAHELRRMVAEGKAEEELLRLRIHHIQGNSDKMLENGGNGGNGGNGEAGGKVKTPQDQEMVDVSDRDYEDEDQDGEWEIDDEIE